SSFPTTARPDGLRPARRITALRRPGTACKARPRGPATRREPAMHLVMIGGSDAGISAALRARELDPGADVTVVLEDAYPNFSIHGIPYYFSAGAAHCPKRPH